MLDFKVERVGCIAKVTHPHYNIEMVGNRVQIIYKNEDNLSTSDVNEPFNVLDKLFNIIAKEPKGKNQFETQEDLFNHEV